MKLLSVSKRFWENWNHFCLDEKNNTVILPIFGMPNPIPISSIDEVILSVEDGFTFLRIKFTQPDSQIGNVIGCSGEM
jgi:nucleosome binding factor SPN SPT16 subunit